MCCIPCADGIKTKYKGAIAIAIQCCSFVQWSIVVVHNATQHIRESFRQPGRPCLASQLEGDEREGGRELLSKTKLLCCCADHFNTQSCEVCPELLQITGPGISYISHRSQWRAADWNTSWVSGYTGQLTGNLLPTKFCVHFPACPPCQCFLSPTLSSP